MRHNKTHKFRTDVKQALQEMNFTNINGKALH